MTISTQMIAALDFGLLQIERQLFETARLLRRHGATREELFETLRWSKQESETSLISQLAEVETELLDGQARERL